VDCYGPYTAKDGVCKFNGTVTSQCPSGSGVPRAYHAENAYAVSRTVSTPVQNDIFYFLYVHLLYRHECLLEIILLPKLFSQFNWFSPMIY